MFDNKTMLLLVLGLVIFLLSRPSKKTQPKVEKKEASKKEDESTDSQTVETFRNTQRVSRGYSHYPFHKKEYLNDEQEDIDFKAEEVVTETESEQESTSAPSNEQPHRNRINIKGSNVQEAYKSTGLLPNNCDPNSIPDNRKANLNKKDLLPGEANKDWFEQVIDVNDENILSAGPREFFGTNTVSNSLRNASYDIRGDNGLNNPKNVVSPWNNTSIGSDNNLKNSVLSNN
jgi:hypothetical protein